MAETRTGKITAATQRRLKKEKQSNELKALRRMEMAARALLEAVRPQGVSHQCLRCSACDSKEIWGKELTEKSFRHHEDCEYVNLRCELANLKSERRQA